jgi:hypothetical protein
VDDEYRGGVEVHCCAYLHGHHRPSLLHMYWEEEWRQAYVVRLFSQHRFAELTRYFHVAAPTPRGVRHTVIDKVRPLYEGVGSGC